MKIAKSQNIGKSSPKKQKVMIETLNEEGKYEVFSKVTKKGVLHSKVLEGFTIEAQTLFENIEQEK